MSDDYDAPRTPPATPAAPRRRWLRFSLQSLFVVVTVFSGWMAYVANRAAEQRLAVAAIQRVHGHFDFDYVEQIISKQLPVPNSLLRVLDEHYFASVTRVLVVGNRSVSPDAYRELLPHLSKMDELRELRLVQIPISDSDLSFIRGMTSVKELDISGTKISDNALECVATLSNLEWLVLADTSVTDLGLRELSGLKLRHIAISGTRASEHGAQQLRRDIPGCDVEFKYRAP
jgi:hypothetical protein